MKKWYLSKTEWFNVVTLAAGLVATVQGNEWVMANPRVSAAVLSAAAVVNILLRLVTNKKVTL